MGRLCILIRTAPYGRLSAAEGIRHLIGAVEAGFATTAILVDDGIYVAKHGQATEPDGWANLSAALQQALSKASNGPTPRLAVYIHKPSAEQRGVERLDLVPGIELIDDERMATVMGAAETLLTF